MSTKNIELVMSPPLPHFVGDGFRVHHFLPGHFRLERERTNPFLLLDYNSKYHFPPSATPKGVGVHPHKGFETVTIAYHGKIAHQDSSGGGGIIGEGDVQWMTAASGVLHKEFHEEEWSKKGGFFQMVQLWVNLPAKDKKSAPKYQSILNQDIPKVPLKNDGGLVEVIAGQYDNTSGAAFTFTPVHLLNVQLNQNGEADFSFPAHYNTMLLVVEGEVLVNQSEKIPTDHFALFENEGEDIHIQASEKSVVLIMSGEPILEPIAAHGPFVMNTHQELAKAFHDYSIGKFGSLD